MLKTVRLFLGGCLFLACLASSMVAAGSSCEPADFVDVSARRLSVTDQGATARVVVELKLNPGPGQPASVLVSGTIRAEAGEQSIAQRTASLVRGRPNKLRYTFDLATGSVHHLLFQARSESDPERVSTAYLRVNLDPSLEPEMHGDVIQYRARMQEEVAP